MRLPMKGNNDELNKNCKNENTYREFLLNRPVGSIPSSNGTYFLDAHVDEVERSLAFDCVIRENEERDAKMWRTRYLLMGTGVIVAGALLSHFFPIGAIAGTASRTPIF